MWPTNDLSNKYFSLQNPKFATRQMVSYCAELGAEIKQNKTVADFMVGYNAVLVSVTNVNWITGTSQSYPESEHFLISSLRGLDAANATLAASAWVAGWGDGLSMNGTFSVTNNGTQALLNMPHTIFQKGTNSPDAGWFTLASPILWVGQTVMNITTTFATAPTTANQNGRIELHGIKLI
jgi:hypothetical protein